MMASSRMVNMKATFECEMSCGTIIFQGDDFYIVDGQCVCPQCAGEN